MKFEDTFCTFMQVHVNLPKLKFALKFVHSNTLIHLHYFGRKIFCHQFVYL